MTAKLFCFYWYLSKVTWSKNLSVPAFLIFSSGNVKFYHFSVWN